MCLSLYDIVFSDPPSTRDRKRELGAKKTLFMSLDKGASLGGCLAPLIGGFLKLPSIRLRFRNSLTAALTTSIFDRCQLANLYKATHAGLESNLSITLH